MIGAMFSGRHALLKDKEGSFFIDRDGKSFRHILTFLRSPLLFDCNEVSGSERLALEREADYFGLTDMMFPTIPDRPCIIKFNVGGCYFTTMLETIREDLDTIFTGDTPVVRDSEGCYFIDRNGTNFHYILDFLRDPDSFDIDNYSQSEYEAIEAEAEYYRLTNKIFPSESAQYNNIKFSDSNNGDIIIISIAVHHIDRIWMLDSTDEDSYSYIEDMLPLKVCTLCKCGIIKYVHSYKWYKGILVKNFFKTRRYSKMQPRIPPEECPVCGNSDLSTYLTPDY